MNSRIWKLPDLAYINYYGVNIEPQRVKEKKVFKGFFFILCPQDPQDAPLVFSVPLPLPADRFWAQLIIYKQALNFL